MESIVLERLLDLSRGLDRAGGPAHRARETAAAGAELLPGRGLSVHLTTAEGEVTAHVGPEMSADLLRLRLGVGPTPLGELVIDQEDLSSHDRRLCRELAATLTAAEEQAAQHMGELTTLHSALAYAVGVALDEVGHRPADLLERALLARQVGACLRPDDQAWLEALERDAIVFDLGRAQVPAELRGRVDLTQAEQALVEERTAAAANTLEALGLHAAAQAAGDGGGSGGGSGGDRAAAILRLVEAYRTSTAPAPHGRGRTHTAAIDRLTIEGGHDARLVAALDAVRGTPRRDGLKFKAA